MSDTGVAGERSYSRWPATVFLSLVALGAAALVGYLSYAGRATVRVEGFGYAIEPGGQVVGGRDAVEIQLPRDEVPRVRIRVPVRNTSRLPLTVRYPLDVGVEPWALDEPPVTRTVRVGPRATVWLEYEHAYRGCPGPLRLAGGGTVGRVGFLVWVTAPGTGEREELVDLPIAYLHPQVELPARCGGLAP